MELLELIISLAIIKHVALGGMLLFLGVSDIDAKQMAIWIMIFKLVVSLPLLVTTILEIHLFKAVVENGVAAIHHKWLLPLLVVGHIRN